MRLSRAEIFDPTEIVAVRTMTRTVRRCFLMGDDPVSGKNFVHRKRWIEEKLKLLAANFGVDLLAFSCMSTHFHLVLRSRPDVVQTCEEGEGLGKFWQSRYKAVRILDEETLLACAAYVDLNPIRAALAETLETSDYTSVQRRIASFQTNMNSSTPNPSATHRADDFLSPIAIDERNDPLGPQRSRSRKRCSDKGFLAMSEADYLTILDWLARNTVAGKRGATPEDAPKIFERLGIDAAIWSEMVKDFGRSFKNVAGKPTSIEQTRSLQSRRKFYRSRV